MGFDIATVCNMALAHVGAKNTVQQVFPTPEGSAEARACHIHFETCRNATLEAVDWAFASRERELSLFDGPGDRWTYRYAWPSDCLAPREIVPTARGVDPIPFDSGLHVQDLPYRAVQRLILTDQPEAVLRYTMEVTDTRLWPSVAIDALAWRLAMNLAAPLTRSADLQRVAAEAFRLSLSQAVIYSANLRREDPPRHSRWHQAR